MKHRIASALLVLGALTGTAQPPVPGSTYTAPPSARHQLDSLYHYLDTSGLYNGVLLVGIGGKKFSAVAIGYANLDTKERLTESSAFELASVSKQFTAVGILTLVQAGKLQLDQPLLSIFPTLPYTGVTIRQLLNHTAGLPEYAGLVREHFNLKRIATNADLVALLSRYHPEQQFAAGGKWEYSNTGYALLGAVIETVSGQPYAQYMEDAVFKPLGLKHTFVYTRRYAPRTIPGYAYGYVEGAWGRYRLPDSIPMYDQVRYLDGIVGDGAVNSTAGDLLRWNNAVHDGKLLTPALWKEALTPVVVNGEDSEYGFGFLVTQSSATGRVLSHNGSWPGYQTENVLYLDKDISLIGLSNKELPRDLMNGTMATLHDILFGRPLRFPTRLRQAAASVDTALFRRYTGVYEASGRPGFTITIGVQDGILTAQATGQGVNRLTPESETQFFIAGAPIKIEFEPNGTGPAARMVLHQNGDHVFVRKDP